LRAEIERELIRLKLVNEQFRAIETERERELAEASSPMVAQLMRLWAIGVRGAWMLVKGYSDGGNLRTAASWQVVWA